MDLASLEKEIICHKTLRYRTVPLQRAYSLLIANSLLTPPRFRKGPTETDVLKYNTITFQISEKRNKWARGNKAQEISEKIR